MWFQLTYSGFLTEIFGSLKAVTQVIEPLLEEKAGGDSGLSQLLTWDSRDPVWQELKDQDYHQACKWLVERQKRYNEGMMVIL